MITKFHFSFGTYISGRNKMTCISPDFSESRWILYSSYTNGFIQPPKSVTQPLEDEWMKNYAHGFYWVRFKSHNRYEIWINRTSSDDDLFFSCREKPIDPGIYLFDHSSGQIFDGKSKVATISRDPFSYQSLHQFLNRVTERSLGHPISKGSCDPQTKHSR